MSISALALALLTVQAVPSDDLVIRNVTIASPERDAVLADQSVRIRDGRIVEISEQLLEPQGEEMLLDGGRGDPAHVGTQGGPHG